MTPSLPVTTAWFTPLAPGASHRVLNILEVDGTYRRFTVSLVTMGRLLRESAEIVSAESVRP